MSRHMIDAIDPKQSVTVGWDRPLQNYFAQVHDADGDIVHWVLGEPTAELMAAEVAPYATVSPELIETLGQEQREGLSHPMALFVDHRTVAKC